MWVTAADATVRARFQRDQRFAAPALDPSQPHAAGGHGRQRQRDCARGYALDDAADQAQGLEDFLEAQHDARGDVAVLVRLHARFEQVVRRRPYLHARVPLLAAGASGEADHAQFAGRAGGEPAAGEKAVLQPGVVVVNVLQQAHLDLQGVALGADRVQAGAFQVAGDAARDDAIHEIAVAE